MLTALQSYIRQVIDLDELLDMTDTAPLRTAEAQKLQRRLDVQRAEVERASKLLMSLYENLTDGVISREEYGKMKQAYTRREQEAETRMNATQESILAAKEVGGSQRSWVGQFRKHENLTELDRSVVVSLIDEIAVHADKQVEIKYRWQDEFAWQLDVLKRTHGKEAV